MDTLINYGITHSAIDSLGYFGGNMLAHKISSELPKANATHTIGFFVSDLLIRNGTISMWSENALFKGATGRNAYIALLSFLINSGVDLIKGTEAGNAIYRNLIMSAISIPTNSAIDMVIPSQYA